MHPGSFSLGVLIWGTPQSNQLDRGRHNTDNSGARNGMSKLTEQIVKDIRVMYKTGNYGQKELAALFLVDASTISDVVNYKSWKI